MIRFYLSQYEDENAVIEAAFEGCPVEKELTNLDDYKPSSVAVVMGVYKKRISASFKRGHVIREQDKNGQDCLILETGYINRGNKLDNSYAFGWNGLNGRADFMNRGMPADRAEKFRSRLRPWKAGGDYVLLCGQVPWDASVDFTDHISWLYESLGKLKQLTKREIVFRPHPLGGHPPDLKCRVSRLENTIEQELENAWCCVNFNSNTGVDAILSGTPVFCFDKGSMVYEMSRHDWDIENPRRPDRTQWLNDICYAQWTPAEMADGRAWRHLLRHSLPELRVKTAVI